MSEKHNWIDYPTVHDALGIGRDLESDPWAWTRPSCDKPVERVHRVVAMLGRLDLVALVALVRLGLRAVVDLNNFDFLLDH